MNPSLCRVPWPGETVSASRRLAAARARRRGGRRRDDPHAVPRPRRAHPVGRARRRHARARLPAGPATEGSTTRYPVIYFLHGLPAAATTYARNKWLDAALDATGHRRSSSSPQGARGTNSDAEYLNWGPGRTGRTTSRARSRRTSTALPHDRLARGPRHRRSLGRRLRRVILGIHNLGRFAAIESWSGYFHPTDPTGTVALDRGLGRRRPRPVASLKARRGEAADVPRVLRRPRRHRFRAENLQFDRELTAAHVPHRFAVYPGGHSSSLWYATPTAG